MLPFEKPIVELEQKLRELESFSEGQDIDVAVEIEVNIYADGVVRCQHRRAILTHMNHELDYGDLARRLPPGVEPAYDGMILDLP